MNRKSTIKLVFFLLISFISTFSFAQCITDVSITTNSFIDNNDGTCTYEIEIQVDHTVDAVSLNISAPDGTFNSCNGGSCAGITTSGGGTTIVTAQITKLCNAEIDIFVRGIGTSGFACGSDGARFLGDIQLPAELISFESVAKDNSNVLVWKTASEENTAVFVIQRSNDGQSGFQSIGRVEASGFSDDVRTYNFTDEDPLSIAYYRLQTIDIDASFEFSDVLVIERAKTEIDLVEVFPMPAVTNEVTVMIHSRKEGPVFIDLFDMTGRVIKQDRIELRNGVNRLVLDWESNEGNVYFFTIYNGKERISKKIIKSNLD